MSLPRTRIEAVELVLGMDQQIAQEWGEGPGDDVHPDVGHDVAAALRLLGVTDDEIREAL